MKINNEDKLELKMKKQINSFLLVIGVFLTLLGASGIVIDYFFPLSSRTYHAWAVTKNLPALFLGLYILSRHYSILKRNKKFNYHIER